MPNQTHADVAIGGEMRRDPVLPRVVVFGGALLLWVVAVVVFTAQGGFGWVWLGVVATLAFAVTTPWQMLCFVNAIAGFVLLRAASDPVARACPPAAVGDTAPIAARTALAFCIRNEDVGRVFARLRVILESLAETGFGERFALHVLSDTDDPVIAMAEEAAFASLRQREPAWRMVYRRRTHNAGYKAGNLRDFALDVAGEYDFILPLDADSLMSGAAILRLVRIMQADPHLAILQSLAVGRPAESAFARVFQFGMRHGMRTHATGLAWYQGPAGPYWGHNALIRLAPFVDHAALPELPGRGAFGGPILSHDQVEAALVRAGGWDVRVLPQEMGSWEENPPDLAEFIRRDLRWCLGNLQYVMLLRWAGVAPVEGWTGFAPMGRFQLVNAVAMYAGAPASLVLLAAGVVAAVATGGGVAAFAGFLTMLALGFLPRLLGVGEALATPAGRARYGGARRLLVGTLFDLLFDLLVWPVVMLSQARFMLGLLGGRRLGWDGQAREASRLRLRAAARPFWLHTVLGGAVLAVLAWRAPAVLPWAMVPFGAWLLAGVVAWGSALPSFGAWMRRHLICAVPDEIAPDPVLRRLAEMRL